LVHVHSTTIFDILHSERIISFTDGFTEQVPPVIFIFGFALYPEPPDKVLILKSAFRVTVALDLGASIEKVGRVVHVPKKVMLSRVPFVIFDVAESPFGQLHPVDVIFGGYI